MQHSKDDLFKLTYSTSLNNANNTFPPSPESEYATSPLLMNLTGHLQYVPSMCTAAYYQPNQLYSSFGVSTSGDGCLTIPSSALISTSSLSPSSNHHYLSSPLSSSAIETELSYIQPLLYNNDLLPSDIIAGNSHACLKCTKTFPTTIQLKAHLKSSPTQSPDAKNFTCEFCSSGFRRSHDLKRHVRSLHLTCKAFGCNFCGKRFARADALKRHSTRVGTPCLMQVV